MKEIEELIDGMEEELKEIRRYFHSHPELSNQEFATADRICEYLDRWGVEYERGIAGTGIVAMVRGKKPGKTVGIRADMDALPVEEENDVPYRSEQPGVMHACGHDAHMTVLLGAAKVFQTMRDRLSGNVKFFFQPAEETTGGALRMIQAGCLANPHVDYVLGLHVSSLYEAGSAGVRYGNMMAASDEFTIKILGASCHGAHPDQGRDAAVTAGAVLGGIQTLVSRNLSPVNPAVCTVGKIQGGTAGNIICSQVTMDGILRSLNPETRQLLRERLTDMAENTARAYGCTAQVVFRPSYPALINCDEVVDVVKETACQVLGRDHVTEEREPDLGTEDFSYFAQERPSCFWHLGCADFAGGIDADLHNCRFDIDEKCLAAGVKVQVLSALKLLEK